MKIKVRDVIKNNRMNPPIHNNYPTKYEEALIVAKVQLKGYYSIGVTQSRIGKCIHSII